MFQICWVPSPSMNSQAASIICSILKLHYLNSKFCINQVNQCQPVTDCILLTEHGKIFTLLNFTSSLMSNNEANPNSICSQTLGYFPSFWEKGGTEAKRKEMFTVFFTWVYHFCGEGNGTPLQYSCLENPVDGGAWWTAVHGIARSWTRLSDFTFTFHFHALDKEMATHSSVLAWRIPGMGEPGGLPSMGSHSQT